MTANVLLKVQGLGKSFRGLRALDDYALELRENDLLGVIGPNGAGKTTLFNLLTGIVKPSAGTVQFGGREIAGQTPETIARAGIARTFQKIRLFHPLSALDNVRIALQMHEPVTLLDVLLTLPRFQRSERALTQQAHAWLERVGIADAAGERAERLTYNQQRRLELACALAQEPRLLLLDEPTAGMNPTETDALMHLILELYEQLGLAIILVEHNMRVIMDHCRRLQVLNYGEIIAEGAPDEIRNDPSVVEAYLGQAGGLVFDRPT